MWVTKTSVMFSGGAPAARRDCGSLPAVGPTSSDEPASIRTSLFSYLIRNALTEASSGLIFVPEIHFRSLIAVFSEFTPSTPSLTAGLTIDDSNFVLNQMVQN